MIAELRKRLERCRRLGYVSSGGVVYDCGLPGDDGAPFELFREPHHDEQIIRHAELELRRVKDVSFLFITRVPSVAIATLDVPRTRFVSDLTTRWSEFPRGGDAVQLVREWVAARGVVKSGDYGFIEGCVGLEYAVGVPLTFNKIPFVGNGFCCGSGGPGTIETPVSQLKPTNRLKRFRCWRWKDNRARIHNSQEYLRFCRVWEWYPE